MSWGRIGRTLCLHVFVSAQSAGENIDFPNASESVCDALPLPEWFVEIALRVVSFRCVNSSQVARIDLASILR